jgi:hypothetical protein
MMNKFSHIAEIISEQRPTKDVIQAHLRHAYDEGRKAKAKEIREAINAAVDD